MHSNRESEVEVPMSDLMESEDSDHDGMERREGREQWASQIEYLLSMIGFCVALGNVWRFPYICQRNGGGAFLIPFVMCLVLCGLPLVFLEVALGQFSGMSPSHVWSLCPLMKGIGIGMLIICVGSAVYLNVICGWAMYYAISSFSTVLPWTNCNNTWNTDTCVAGVEALHHRLTGEYNATSDWVNKSYSFNTTDFNITTYSSEDLHNQYRTAAEEFWHYKALGISKGIDEIGSIKWEMALCLLASWFLIFICAVKGVRSVGKAVYVTATLPYVILTVLLIRGLTLPGGTDGAVFYFTPNFSKLLEVQVWLEACLQVFYSLGVAWGCIITMSSYTKFNTNCLRNAIVCTFLCEGTSMYAGLVVFTILGYMSHEASVPITEVVSSGPGLGFVIYPEALAHLPVPQLWSFIFFVMIILLAMDSLFSQVETFMTAILDEYHSLVKWRIPIAAVYCLVSFLVGLVMTTQGGVYVFQLVDWYIVALFITFVALLECIMVSWLYGIDRFSGDIQLMIGRPAPLFFKITWCYITPAMLLMTIVFTFAQYKLPTYGEYVYPYYSTVIGWIIASLPLMPVIIMMFLAIYRGKGGVFQRIKMSLKPDDTWGPSEPSYRAEYIKKHRRPSTLKSAFKSSISWKG
ncbi:sodium- and chloride-dependent glycine transporter 2-like isoform X1 [Haliotis rubra]|uniref:sodium- and chloride-dependent glycine transporter 2-like isoform X1 n=2 Tax=Haliotis rubra TaxID=36100 RepID=UPI001EE5658A|nr:sodium- and chloride-dependent glycine transporter 2-like isoform X1 [Haliotis rubra]XP_046558840.1 sodium- and chloride-dependent glycine transporter 2-like isoform X1 [Haliotis rubra]